MHSSIKREISVIARSSPDHEVCGFICANVAGGTPFVFPCPNSAENPAEEFQIDALDYLRAESAGQILGVYHSHPVSAGFSEADLECAEELAIPFYLYDIQGDKWSEYLPSTYQPLIECAPFVLGFADCYELIRRYFRAHYKLYLSDYDRDESFCYEEQGVIMANFEKEGFELVDSKGLRRDDVILFRTDKALPQHFGVFLGNSEFLHHPRGALSRRETLTGRWQSRIFHVLRLKK
jgi:proteasome lid subunit RPN8/RPN11